MTREQVRRASQIIALCCAFGALIALIWLQFGFPAWRAAEPPPLTLESFVGFYATQGELTDLQFSELEKGLIDRRICAEGTVAEVGVGISGNLLVRADTSVVFREGHKYEAWFWFNDEKEHRTALLALRSSDLIRVECAYWGSLKTSSQNKTPHLNDCKVIQ